MDVAVTVVTVLVWVVDVVVAQGHTHVFRSFELAKPAMVKAPKASLTCRGSGHVWKVMQE